PDDLARSHADRYAPDRAALDREPVDFKQSRGRPVTHFWENLGNHPPGHELDELVIARRLRIESRDLAPVAQHRDAIADAANFAHPMSDIDDADACLLRLVDEGEEPVGLALGKRCGWLIEDEARGLRAESCGD